MVSEKLCPYLKEKGLCVVTSVRGDYDCPLFGSDICIETHKSGEEAGKAIANRLLSGNGDKFTPQINYAEDVKSSKDESHRAASYDDDDSYDDEEYDDEAYDDDSYDDESYEENSCDEENACDNKEESQGVRESKDDSEGQTPKEPISPDDFSRIIGMEL